MPESVKLLADELRIAVWSVRTSDRMMHCLVTSEEISKVVRRLMPTMDCLTWCLVILSHLQVGPPAVGPTCQ